MAKREKPTQASKPSKVKAKPAEPFFRPFSKLAKLEKPVQPRTERAAPRAARGVSGPPRAPAALEQAKPPPVEPDPVPVDASTFAVYMAGVRVLSEDRAHRIPRNESRVERVPLADRAPRGDLDADAHAALRSLVVEGIRFETADDGERLEGRRLDVDPREVRRLRRGEHAIDGKIDLHGLGVEEARKAVEAFIKKRALDGDRVIVVVHGKGSHSPRGHAVLRGEIAAWLSQGRAARHVAAFASAPEDLGGGGALFVLLAR